MSPNTEFMAPLTASGRFTLTASGTFTLTASGTFTRKHGEEWKTVFLCPPAAQRKTRTGRNRIHAPAISFFTLASRACVFAH